ncbi:MAG TPA: four-helix bundle copper-binding protein [Gemmataceae bacterium]|jgi:hypothetical protein|nr:four-helix bundle copper-binding protein [Gemmataceae bacterium]
MFRIVCAIAIVSAFQAQAQAPKSTHDAHAAAFLECARACDDCARICDACSAHCAQLVADGKKEHLTTLKTCQDCATVCQAASAIVAKAGPFSDVICHSCAEACKRCGDACEKVGDDKMMKECAAECRKCEKACRDMLKHTGHAAGHAK